MKPIVYFVNDPVFNTKIFPGYEVAYVKAIDHPIWGSYMIRTSEVVKKFSDGSFETLTTAYRPYKGTNE